MDLTRTSDGTQQPEPCNEGLADTVSLALRWIDKGYHFEKVSEATAKMRIAICEGCKEHFIEDERRCDVCCCPMDFKVTLKYDPIQGIMKKTLITCPVGKW